MNDKFSPQMQAALDAVETMSDEQQRQERMAVFDAEAHSPREGWHQIPPRGDDNREIWIRAVGTMRAGVLQVGQAWVYYVGEDGEILAQGHSSRRGCAMLGADHAIDRKTN